MLTKVKSSEVQQQIKNLWQMIGNTPMIRIDYRYKGGAVQSILVKCEHYNLTGSIKDRMELYIMQKAYEQDQIKLSIPL